MKVLLTGASGFVGSHVLDQLRRQRILTVLLTRATSNTRFLGEHLQLSRQHRPGDATPHAHALPPVEVRTGCLEDKASLAQALDGITHVVHCAGCTKATRLTEFDRVNHSGTRNLAEAAAAAGVTRFIHVSSLAAAGPGTPARPCREQDPPNPVSEYGRSKLRGENAVRELLPQGHVILRPPAVYGPRDSEFLRVFQAVKRHVLPRPGAQELSLVYVEDLAAAIVACLNHPSAPAKTFYVANPETVSTTRLAEAVARAVGHWTVPVPIPTLLLWPVCLWADLKARVTNQANVLGLQKYPELRAAGWVCDSSRLERELGLRCPTGLREGIEKTLAWYRSNKWL